MSKNKLARSALVIATGGFLSKIIGAVYRIPLTNIIGAEGIGLYQLVFPLYTALLTLSSTGLPTALSKLVAQNEKDAVGYFRRSVVLFGGIGLITSVLMFVLGGILAKLQGNYQAAWCYRALSPSVFFVSVISCLRGYFQGKGIMYPTALSQVLEQIVKAAFGLGVCYIFKNNIIIAAIMATFAVTVSEVVALIFLLVIYKIKVRGKYGKKGTFKQILSLTVPVALSAIILPLGSIADSFIIVNIMGKYTQNATVLYGIYSGSIAAIVGAPIAIAYGVAVACVPSVASGEVNKIADSLRFTGFIAIPCAIFLMFFSGECVNFLYGGMSAYEKLVASQILTLDSVSVVLLAYVQTTNAILIAMGKQKIPLLSMGLSLFIRILMCLGLVSNSGVGIRGAVIAANIAHLITLSINLYFVGERTCISSVVLPIGKITLLSIICVLSGFYLNRVMVGKVGFVVSAIFTVMCYFILSWALNFLENRFAITKVKLKRLQ